jgi:TolB-like protein/Flp pilus assembly protein TadD
VTETETTRETVPPQAQPLNILVLPFTAVDSAAVAAQLADGIVEELITALARVPRFCVPSWTAVSNLCREGASRTDVAGVFHADLVVEGSARVCGERVRVLVRLARANTPAVIWADAFEAEARDTLHLVERLVSKLLEACGVTDAPVFAMRAHSAVLDAYELYLMSRRYWNSRSVEGMRRAIELATRALERDPSYSLAEAVLALSYATLASYTPEPPSRLMELGRTAAQRALAIDDDLSDAHTALGFIQLALDWKFDDARQSFSRASAIDPANATVLQFSSIVELVAGRLEETTALCATAEALDPASLILKAHTAWMLYFMRRNDSAIDHLLPVVERYPQFWRGQFNLAWPLLVAGRHAEGVAAMEQAAAWAEYGTPHVTLACAYAVAGRTADAERHLQDVLNSPDYVSSYWIGVCMVALGRPDDAMQWLWRAYEDREWYLLLARSEPRLDPIRQSARFQELLRAVGV